MNAEYTAIITKDGDWWIGWVEEIPGANAQEETKEAVTDIIKIHHQQARSEIIF
ncbi:hypothetical protein ACN4EE_02255 [Geminocystis sp. CENA526]|uniref:hypothetical protein n=1 Tax=Geminocystis sp. CENA526 TaxID=1355871 RepID=UPI003D6ED9DE